MKNRLRRLVRVWRNRRQEGKLHRLATGRETLATRQDIERAIDNNGNDRNLRIDRQLLECQMEFAHRYIHATRTFREDSDGFSVLQRRFQQSYGLPQIAVELHRNNVVMPCEITADRTIDKFGNRVEIRVMEAFGVDGGAEIERVQRALVVRCKDAWSLWNILLPSDLRLGDAIQKRL